MQEMYKSSSSSSDQMLNEQLEALRKEYMQLVDIHSKCKSNKGISVSTRTVARVCNVFKFLAVASI